MKSVPLLALGIALLAGTPARAADTILHFFSGGSSDGALPMGDLTVSGSTLYGLTPNGGLNNAGTIFKLDASGSGFSVLKSLAAGSNPSGSLALSGSALYGMTSGGGTGGLGTIFTIQSNGSGFS